MKNYLGIKSYRFFSNNRFSLLPERGKEIYLYNKIAYHYYNIYDISGVAYEKCQSPVEKIFGVAYDFFQNALLFPGADGIHADIEPQVEIFIGDKSYIVDFLISIVWNNDGEHYYYCEKTENVKKIDFCVEIDGHDYHSTKEQLTHDRKRENDLKAHGFDVIRFTGSQVYNEPIGCVLDTLKILRSKVLLTDSIGKHDFVKRIDSTISFVSENNGEFD